MNGYEDTISVDQVIASTKMKLGIPNISDYDVELEVFINEGIRHLSTNQLFVKKPCVLELEDGKDRLPSGFRKLLGVRYLPPVTVVGVSGIECPLTSCLPILYIDKRFAAGCGCDNLNRTEDFISSCEIRDGWIYFTRSPNDGSRVEISYMGFATGDDCNLLIHPDYERALSAYARYNLLNAYPHIKEPHSMNLADKAYMEWKAQKDWVKGIAARQNFDNNKYYIKRIYKAWFMLQNVV